MRTAPDRECGQWLDHSGHYLYFFKDTAELFRDGVTRLDDGRRESQARKEPSQQEKDLIKCKCVLF